MAITSIYFTADDSSNVETVEDADDDAEYYRQEVGEEPDKGLYFHATVNVIIIINTFYWLIQSRHHFDSFGENLPDYIQTVNS